MIQFSSQLFYFGLQSCLICGSYRVAEIEMCELCTRKLENKIDLFETAIVEKELCINFSVYSLIRWIPAESDFLSRLFLRLKGDQRKNIWNLIAALLAKELYKENKFYPLRKNAVITSCPSKTGQPDHAEQLAKALSETLSIPILPLINLVWK